MQVQIADQSLTSFGIADNGQMCCVGMADGSCTVLQLSKGLYEMAPNEKQGINAMFERETLREKNLEKAIKEAKVKARKEAAKKDDLLDTLTDEAMQQLEADFFRITSEE